MQEVEEYVEKIKAGGGNATVYTYPGEGHAFMNSDPDSFKRMESEPHAPSPECKLCLTHSELCQELHQRRDEGTITNALRLLCVLGLAKVQGRDNTRLPCSALGLASWPCSSCLDV